MTKELRRRKFIQLGTTSIAGIAGCSDDSKRRVESSTSTNSAPSGPSSKTTDQTSTENTTGSISPIEHEYLIGAHYYAWYWGDDGFGGRNHAEKNPNSWLSATPGTPILGPYDSRDKETVNQHMRWALEHGINWWLLTGGAPGGPIDTTNREIILEGKYADLMTFSLTIGFPPEIRTEDGMYDFDHPEAKPALIRWFQHWEDNYATHPNYLRIGDERRPPLYFWKTTNTKGDVVNAFEAARNAVDVNPYIIGGPEYYDQPIDIEYYSSTFDAVMDYHSYYPDTDFLQNFRRRVITNHQRWQKACQEYELGFIPTVTPGFNHSEAPSDFRGGRLLPTLKRDKDRFQAHCQQLSGFGDLNAIVITSFNEWPEFTAIEPSKEYGKSYLDIVADELAHTNWETPEQIPYTRISLKYDRTVVPAELNSENTDTRHLAIAMDTLRCSGPNESVSIDVGGNEGEAVLTKGVFGPSSDNQRTFRWFGGDDALSEVYLPIADVSKLEVIGRAPIGEIDVTVQTESTLVGTMTIGAEWGTYTTN